MDRIVVLGATGSLGSQVLEVIKRFPSEFEVIGLSGWKNMEHLRSQVREFHPPFCFPDPHIPSVKILSPTEMARLPEVDTVVVASACLAGLYPTLSALRAGKRVLLAEKEVLVAAGERVVQEAKNHRTQILPLDSELSAVLQCLEGSAKEDLSRVIITASGGPFLRYPKEKLSQVTPDEALKHPTWRMGKKITVDCATLMNKGFEVMEVHYLFGLPLGKIEIAIHPQSIVHALVEFSDGVSRAILSPPDMRYFIQYALFHSRRRDSGLGRLSFPLSLEFEAADSERFPSLGVALKAASLGGTYPAALIAADEVAVEAFLRGDIPFTHIPEVISRILESHTSTPDPSLPEVMATYEEVKVKAQKANAA